MNHYEQKQAEKKERLEEAAARARRKSDSILKTASDRAAMIPLGQPMMPGHYSYKRDRNFRSKIQRGFERAHEESKRAEELASRAASVGTGGISADDPDAVVKLKEKLSGMQIERAAMKNANALYRKTKGTQAEKAAAVRASGLLTDAQWADYLTTLRVCPYQVAKCLFPSYAITNLGANIRRVEQRIEQLTVIVPEAPDIEGPGYRIVDNAEENRTQIKFQAIPIETVRTELKQSGFRWSPSEKAWQRQRSYHARAEALRVCERHYAPKAPDEPVLVQAAEPEPPGFKIPPPPFDGICLNCGSRCRTQHGKATCTPKDWSYQPEDVCPHPECGGTFGNHLDECPTLVNSKPPEATT